MNTPLVIGALIVSILLMFWLFSVVRATFKTAFFIAVVIFSLQLLTGIGPQQVWGEVIKIFASIPKWLQNWGGKSKPPAGMLEFFLIFWD
jgi:hypothetical protein